MHCFPAQAFRRHGKRNRAICAQPANMPPSRGDPAARWNNGAAVHLGPPADAPVLFYADVGCKTAPGGPGTPGHDHAARPPPARPVPTTRTAAIRRRGCAASSGAGSSCGWPVTASTRRTGGFRARGGTPRWLPPCPKRWPPRSRRLSRPPRAPPSRPGTSHDTFGRHRVADARDRRQLKSGDELEFVVGQSPARSW